MKKKLSSLANDLLKIMVHSYYESHVRRFSFDFFVSLFPAHDPAFIGDALYLLERDGLVSVFSADDVAYITTLDVDAIRESDVDTWIRRGYSVIKELKEWL